MTRCSEAYFVRIQLSGEPRSLQPAGVSLPESEHLNVSEAAVAVGYSNMSKFTAAFRKQYGCTPNDYRKNRLQKHSFRNPIS
ncbi:helix-turn-helix domain-containing protein [Paenibacillus doosanensis]|uniref:helix-turn-helix domain-containing protein n=1 Tax=Paenibacillus doosanensis TaxID=1229154 RepID=UPI00217F9A5E|nr:helix-turn-helix domain-containing protein [Paenibacillus doosanensis]MCS7463359.1 helix-turn-helix domain-containing protein [Paenibacillus doosanensis]